MQNRITGRVVNVKRHTRAYLFGKQRVTRGAVVKMARRGKVADVTAKCGPDGWYVASRPSAEVNLYDLPIVVEA